MKNKESQKWRQRHQRAERGKSYRQRERETGSVKVCEVCEVCEVYVKMYARALEISSSGALGLMK